MDSSESVRNRELTGPEALFLPDRLDRLPEVCAVRLSGLSKQLLYYLISAQTLQNEEHHANEIRHT